MLAAVALFLFGRARQAQAAIGAEQAATPAQ
jgi:hypothetical protein